VKGIHVRQVGKQNESSYLRSIKNLFDLNDVGYLPSILDVVSWSRHGSVGPLHRSDGRDTLFLAPIADSLFQAIKVDLRRQMIFK
jgi:hypothetical protein